jgi:ubiquinone biosynthesis protein UbiJ
MDVAQLLSATVENALNRYIRLDPDGPATFASLEGRVIVIELSGVDVNLAIFPSADEFMLLTDFDGEADARLRGTPLAFAKLALAQDKRDQLFSGEIELSGDTRLANKFSLLFSQLNIDWEELVAKGLGDIAAHKIGNGLRSVQQWLARTGHSVSLDSGEYLQEEARLSPANAELRSFIQQVDELREGTDRLAARLRLLHNQLIQKSSSPNSTQNPTE